MVVSLVEIHIQPQRAALAAVERDGGMADAHCEHTTARARQNG
jgi:hypothetical protein